MTLLDVGLLTFFVIGSDVVDVELKLPPGIELELQVIIDL